MQPIKVFVPINEKSSKIKYFDVMRSITEQKEVDLEIKEVFFFDIKKTDVKWKPIVKQYCRQLMLDYEHEFTIINDCDYKNLFNNNYKRMLDFLKTNKDYGAVSLYAPTSPSPEFFHICAGIIMFRKDALKVTKFDQCPALSSCVSIMDSLRRNNYKYSYLEKKPTCIKL